MFTKQVSKDDFEQNSKLEMLNDKFKLRPTKSMDDDTILTKLERSRLKLQLSEEKEQYLNKSDSELSEKHKLMKELSHIYSKIKN